MDVIDRNAYGDKTWKQNPFVNIILNKMFSSLTCNSDVTQNPEFTDKARIT